MLLLVAVRVCVYLYAYWCQVEELTPPKQPMLCDMKEYEKRSTSDWVGLRKLWHGNPGFFVKASHDLLGITSLT